MTRCVRFDRHADLHHKFPLREGSYLPYWPSVTVNNHHQVFVCDTDGWFVHSLGVGKLGYPRGIAATNNDQVMVLDYDATPYVHVFSAQGDHLRQFTVQGDLVSCGIAFHRSSDHVVVSSYNRGDNENRGQVSIYTIDGEFVGSVQLDTENSTSLSGVTVTVDGRIAVTSYGDRKVYIV